MHANAFKDVELPSVFNGQTAKLFRSRHVRWNRHVHEQPALKLKVLGYFEEPPERFQLGPV